MTTTIEVSSADSAALQAAVGARIAEIQQGGGTVVSVQVTGPTTAEIAYAAGA